jgi:glycosyltransferase involved in cell wall biosynthesis
MSSAPKISVVMTVYNGAAYLREAVSSILNQTFKNFEFIIINNGSTDNTQPILNEYLRQDSRIQVYYHKQEGWAPALNYGCRLARGEYIAMMDGDDYSYPYRFDRQLSHIAKAPRTGVLGSWIARVKNGVSVGNWCPSTSSQTLKWNNFFGVCMPHPTLLVRREVLEALNFYREDMSHAQDVDFFLRASTITELGVVPEVLYRYRVWDGSETQRNLQKVREIHVGLLTLFIREFLQIDPLPEAVAGLRKTRIGPCLESYSHIQKTVALIQELYARFGNNNNLTPQARKEISRDVAKRIGCLALQAARFEPKACVSLLMAALKLDYHLLNPTSVWRGWERHRSLSLIKEEVRGDAAHS